MTYKLLGKNFTPHDVLAKVTGQAKYADFDAGPYLEGLRTVLAELS